LYLSNPKINAEEVVDKWWCINSANCDVRDRFCFELIATTLISVPRLLEFAKDYIDAELVQSNSVSLTKESVQGLYKELSVQIKGRYSVISFEAAPDRKSAIIFQEKIKFEANDSMLFRKSYFTGSLPGIGWFTPHGSIFMLAAYDISGTRYSDLVLPSFNDPSMIFINAFDSILKSIVSDYQGDVLEAVGTSWLIARLVASSLNGEKTVSAERLLGINIERNGVYIPDIATPIVSKEFVLEKNRLPAISSNVKDFAKKFNKEVFVADAKPCTIYTSANGQQYDLMLVYLAKGKPFVLFIDFKSKRILEPSAKALPVVEFTPDFEQFRKVQNAILEVGALGGKEKLSPVSQALVDGNYAFVYATTHPNVKQADDNKVYVTTNDEMMKFMSLLKPYYELSRSANH
jgi:hypothetical protein